MEQRKRLDVHVKAELRDYVYEESERTGRPLNAITDELLAFAIASKRGEVIEQQSLPIIRDIVRSELRQQLAQQRSDLREDMALEFTNELKEVTYKSDNRLVSLIMRTTRDSTIARRLLYTVLAKAHGPEFAFMAYEDAKEKAGKELAKRSPREKAGEES